MSNHTAIDRLVRVFSVPSSAPFHRLSPTSRFVRALSSFQFPLCQQDTCLSVKLFFFLLWKSTIWIGAVDEVQSQSSSSCWHGKNMGIFHFLLCLFCAEMSSGFLGQGGWCPAENTSATAKGTIFYIHFWIYFIQLFTIFNYLLIQVC